MAATEEVERQLRSYGNTRDDRDGLVLRAHEAGISKTRIHRLTGIARTTIDRIIGKAPADRPATDHPDQPGQEPSLARHAPGSLL